MEHLQNLQEKDTEYDKRLSFTLSPQINNKLNFEKEIDSIFKNNPVNLKVFGICGGSACGKSKITKYFQSKINRSIVIAEKDFLKKENSQRKKSYHEDKENLFAVSNSQDGYSLERKQKLIDMNDPDFYDWERLADALIKIKNYEKVFLPFYNYEDEILLQDNREVYAGNISMIFVEGMFIFKNAKLRDLFDFKIFVEVDEDIRLSRMVLTENKVMKNIPTAFKSFFIIYEKYIKAFYEKYVEPTKKYANIFLPNFNITPEDEIEENPALEFLLVYLQNFIKKRRDSMG